MVTHQTGHTPDFEPVETVGLVGGALCFDFTNTGSNRVFGPFRDRLGSYADLVTWSRRVGLLDDGGASEMLAEAAGRPEAAAAVLARARTLRETIYRLFSSSASGREPSAQDIEDLNAALAEAGGHRRLEADGDGWTWTWARGAEPLAWPLWPVVESAAELLTEGEVERIKECQADDCTWLFYDASRNRSRRWCDMKDCGNAAKQRRHYRRRKGADASDAASTTGQGQGHV